MLPAAAAHVFVADLDQPATDEADTHHLARALRLRPGQPVTAGDGAGSWRCCRFAGGAQLEPDGPVEHDPLPTPRLTIGFAPVKGDRPEWTVQKLTEIGVDRIVPFVARRSVVHWEGERAARQVARWRRVAHQAAMQSRRAWLPELSELSDLAGALDRLGRPVALAHPGGPPPTLACPTVLVGPEGGWAPEELASGPATVGLGPTVLRAETAALAAGVVLAALRSGAVLPAI